VDILENQTIINNCCEGFNHDCIMTINRRSPLYLVLEGFLKREYRSQQILCQNSVAVGGNSIDANKRHKLVAINRWLSTGG
jgi:hypothetical protein